MRPATCRRFDAQDPSASFLAPCKTTAHIQMVKNTMQTHMPILLDFHGVADQAACDEPVATVCRLASPDPMKHCNLSKKQLARLAGPNGIEKVGLVKPEKIHHRSRGKEGTHDLMKGCI